LTKFFTNFHSKLEMSIYMKVVSLNKPDNFHKGRLCLGEIWRTRQKFRRTFINIRVSVGFGRVFDQGLTPGCVDLVKGFNRDCRLGFRGDGPG
jgi:hypothetical protein